ncbi:MAG: hypothetical protein PHE43_03410 [Candidatus Nanoarchaeia archaeon]|nr:hypothetical protein [Candidatus Nanoarchaeia archaeon]
MKQKRGASDVIGWVLLIGFSIALAAGVFTWIKGQTTEMTESTVNYVEGEMTCEDVAINIKPEISCSQIIVSNKGKFTVDAIRVILYPASGDPTSELITEKENNNLPLKPMADPITLDLTPSVKIEVTPVIKVDDNYNGCSTKKEVITCP